MNRTVEIFNVKGNYIDNLHDSYNKTPSILYLTDEEVEEYFKQINKNDKESVEYEKTYGRQIDITKLPDGVGGVLKNGIQEFYKVNVSGESFVVVGGRIYKTKEYFDEHPTHHIGKLRFLTKEENSVLAGKVAAHR